MFIKSFTTYLILVAVFTVIMMNSCKKSESKPIPVGVTMVANSNNPWVATSYSAAIDTGNGLSYVYILGTDACGTSLAITVYKAQTGVYYYNNSVQQCSVWYTPCNTGMPYTPTGSVTITQLSQHNVQGTFNCEALSGEFNIPVQ